MRSVTTADSGSRTGRQPEETPGFVGNRRPLWAAERSEAIHESAAATLGALPASRFYTMCRDTILPSPSNPCPPRRATYTH